MREKREEQRGRENEEMRLELEEECEERRESLGSKWDINMG